MHTYINTYISSLVDIAKSFFALQGNIFISTKNFCQHSLRILKIFANRWKTIYYSLNLYFLYYGIVKDVFICLKMVSL